MVHVTNVRKHARYVLAENLRALRRAKQLSQEQLADLTGLHRTYIGSVERLERNISIDNIEKLAHALNVKVHELLAPRGRGDK